MTALGHLPGATVAAVSADSPRVLREINDQVVLTVLLERGPLTRGRVGELTGLSKPTVSSLLSRLQQRGLITELGVVEGGPGPNARLYAVDPGAAHVIGVHVEQGGATAAAATLTGTVLATHRVSVAARRAGSPLGEISAAVDGVIGAANLPRARIHRLVVATPGVIDPVTGHLRHARHIRGWEAPGLIEAITESLGIPVSHGNDVNLAAVAEGARGAARDRDDYALLWMGQGVGLGLVLDGALRTGAHGGAGEIGYLGVPGIEAPRADRGGTGAFQQLVGGQGIRALARKHGIRGRDPAGIVGAAVAGSAGGADLLADLAAGVALGVAAVTSLLDPGLVVLAGPVALAGGAGLRDRVLAQLGQISFVKTDVVTSTLTADGVLSGALEVALRTVRAELFGQPSVSAPGRVG